MIRSGFILFLVFILVNTLGQTRNSLCEMKIIRSELVFDQPPFKACHASTIMESKRGKFLISCFGGTQESAPDVGIWLASSKGRKWTAPREIVSSNWGSEKFACWNPVLFKSTDGTIRLFYKQGKSPREWWGMLINSSDKGKTWSSPVKLPDGFLGPIRNKAVQLSNGNVLCPSSTESMDDIWSVHMEIADATFSKWEKSYPESTEGFGVIQPTVLFHPGGKLQILCRSRQNKIVQSWSTDNGEHWSKLEAINLPNPNSGIDAVTLSSGLHVLVYNPLLSGKHWSNGRNVLKVAVSNDGVNWQDVYTLEEQQEGEFSYPAIIESSDALLHITYTYNRINIKHVVLKPEIRNQLTLK